MENDIGSKKIGELVLQFAMENVSEYPPVLYPKVDSYMTPLSVCLKRLSDDVLGELVKKDVVHVPYDIPFIVDTHENLKSIILLPQSIQRWRFDARVGAIASAFACAITDGTYCRSTIDLVREWGFEKEVEASHEQIQASI